MAENLPELATYAQLDKLLNAQDINERYNDFTQVHEKLQLEMSINEYFRRFWEDDAPFNITVFGDAQGHTKQVIKPWTDNVKMLSQVVPVKGVPFCKITGMTVKHTIIERSDTRIMIEMEAHTIDAPYSSTFYVKEVWIVVTTEKNHPRCLFQRKLTTMFVQKTWLKSQISEGARKGVTASHLEWLKMAQERGFLNKQEEFSFLLEQSIIEFEDEEEKFAEEMNTVEIREAMEQDMLEREKREHSEGSEMVDGNPYDLPNKSTDKKKSASKYFNFGEVFYYNPFKSKKKEQKEEDSKSRKSNKSNRGESTFREADDSQDYSFFNEYTPILADLKDDEGLEEEEEEQNSFQIQKEQVQEKPDENKLDQNKSDLPNENLQLQFNDQSQLINRTFQNQRNTLNGDLEGQEQKVSSYEQMIEEAGGYGEYQQNVNNIIMLCLIFASCLFHALPYLLLVPDFNCYEKIASGLEVLMTEDTQCVPSLFCSNPNIRGAKIQNQNMLQNWVQEFEMICVNQFIFVSFYMVMFVGFMFGGLFVAPISDSIGRKKILLVSLTGICVLHWMLLYQKDYHDLQYSVFFYGILLVTAIVSGVLMMTQMVSRANQAFIITQILVAFALASVFVTAYFRYTNYGWRFLIECATIALILMTVTVWILTPESPKYLYDKEEYSELDLTLRTIARTNGKYRNNSNEEFQGASQFVRLQRQNLLQKDTTRGNPYKELTKNPLIFNNFVCLIGIWVVSIFDHFLVNYEFRMTKQDIFKSSLYQAGFDACAYILAYIYFQSVGLIQTFFRSFALGLIGIVTLMGFLYGYHGSEAYCIGLFLLTCKIGLSAAYANAFFSIILMFKSRVQGTALGICISAGYMVTIFAPVVAKYEPIWIPMSIIAIFCFLGAIFSLLINKMPRDLRQDTEYNVEDIRDLLDMNMENEKDGSPFKALYSKGNHSGKHSEENKSSNNSDKSNQWKKGV